MSYTDKIDALKRIKKMRSDADAAKFLGLSRTGIMKIRNGGGIKPSTAVKLAEGLGVDPEQFVIESLMSQEHDPKTRKVYRSIAKHLGTAASVIGLPYLATALANNPTVNVVYHYILCKMMGFRKSAILSVSCPNYQSSFSVP
jgi:transcriptional regulator with XRE-family HTH domain